MCSNMEYAYFLNVFFVVADLSLHVLFMQINTFFFKTNLTIYVTGMIRNYFFLCISSDILHTKNIIIIIFLQGLGQRPVPVQKFNL